MKAERRRRSIVAVVGALLLLATTACQLIDQQTNQPVTKVMLVGDSVIWYNAPYLQDRFDAYGVEVLNYALPGSGPLYDQKLWAREVEQKLETYPADIVIFQSCCHYPGGPAGSPLYVNDDGVTVEKGSDLMWTELAKANEELVQIARDAGASPYWIKIPPGTQGSLYYGADILEMIDGFNALVDQLDVPVLDWGAAVLAEPNVDDLRHLDGIHYTTAGNQFVANYTFTHTVAVASP